MITTNTRCGWAEPLNHKLFIALISSGLGLILLSVTVILCHEDQGYSLVDFRFLDLVTFRLWSNYISIHSFFANCFHYNLSVPSFIAFISSPHLQSFICRSLPLFWQPKWYTFSFLHYFIGISKNFFHVIEPAAIFLKFLQLLLLHTIRATLSSVLLLYLN